MLISFWFCEKRAALILIERVFLFNKNGNENADSELRFQSPSFAILRQ
jgi:hypothetical protein